VNGIFELWGHGTTYEELEKSVREYPDERKLPFLTPDSTFKIVVDSFGKVISSQEQNEIMQSLTYIPFKVDDMFDPFMLLLLVQIYTGVDDLVDAV
jgi:tRNA (guanine10-N2)-methyltransferase